MRARRILGAALFLLLSLTLGHSASWADGKPPVFDVISVNSAITPPVSEYIVKSIEGSTRDGSAGVIIELDTPGGLDSAMRDIVKSLLNSKIPVFVYVSPPGARAASAGAIITVAANIAAMAPGTNIGAAHPVGIGIGKMDETMVEKVVNDMAAYARGIAVQRGRNAEWVEKAVRKSVSVTAEEALRLRVIDYVAPDVESLLNQTDGKEVILASGKTTLKTKGAVVNRKKMGFRERVLTTISDPNIAYLLMLIGLAGLYFEFAHPGAVIPGVVGGISLILAFFALQTLPVNYAGVLMILLAIILFIAEVKVVSHGILTIGGIVSLILGSLILYESPDPALRVSLGVMVPAIVLVSLFFVAVISLAVKAQLRKPETGMEGMVGKEGVAITAIHQAGKVLVGGEYWNAESERGISEGSRIKVLGMKGLKLIVEEIK
ncbi:MAG: nodulation protein NfeD [Syntrophobacterales bacterium]|nr:nodulation protein NfeD [Syntrophobacterales bacterium]